MFKHTSCIITRDWKINSERNGIWYRALVNRYGSVEVDFKTGGRGRSTWWNDISNLDLGEEEVRNNYVVKEVYKDMVSLTPNSSNSIWSKAGHSSIPNKVSFLLWKLFQNRIATKDILHRRGVLGQDVLQCVGDACVKNLCLIFSSSVQYFQVFGMLSIKGSGSPRYFKRKVYRIWNNLKG